MSVNEVSERDDGPPDWAVLGFILIAGSASYTLLSVWAT
jgi:hypothetical protein